MTRVKANAEAPAASADERRRARAKAQRSFAAARLQVCANVFANSRIHFDPRQRDLTARAIDFGIAGDGATPAVAGGAAPGAAAAMDRDAKITIH